MVPDANRRTARRCVFVTLAFLLAACRNVGVTVILLDTSASFVLEERTVARASLDAVLSGTRPGDRVVLGTISEQSVLRCRFLLDATMPNTGVIYDDRDAGDTLGVRFRSVFDSVLQSSKVQESNILDAVTCSNEVFSRERRAGRKRLVVISDMVHEYSHDYNFRTLPIDSAATMQIIEQRRATGSFPDLRGVEVHVSGAGGVAARPESYFDLRRFWTRYFAATGATLDSSFYGRLPAGSFQ